jgi:hypothetical protein
MTMDSPSDPVLSLENDHQTVAGLFQSFSAAEPEERTDILRNIVRELSVHAAVEEKEIYPLVRQVLPEGDRLADEAEAEHQRMKEILDDLDGADGSDPEVESQVEALEQELMHHVQEEQSEILQQLRWSLPPAEFTALGERVEEARRIAPTRPHPRTSAGGVTEKIASVVDRARDAVRRDSDDDEA